MCLEVAINKLCIILRFISTLNNHINEILTASEIQDLLRTASTSSGIQQTKFSRPKHNP